MLLDLRILALLIFLSGAGLGGFVARRVPAAPDERTAKMEYAVGLSRAEYVRLDRRLLALEAKEPFREFQVATLAAAVNQVGSMANGLLAAVRVLFARIGAPSPV